MVNGSGHHSPRTELKASRGPGDTGHLSTQGTRMNTATQHQQTEPPPPWAAYMPAADTPLLQLRIDDVLTRTGYSRRSWYDAMKNGTAPSGKQRGGTVVWSSHEIEAFNRWQQANLPPARAHRSRRRG